MTVHDWTRVDAGTFHDFHLSWISHLKEALNGGLLPSQYYAQAEHHAGRRIADVLTLHASDPETAPAPPSRPAGPGAVAVAEAPPRAAVHLTGRAVSPKGKPRTLAIRTAAGHRIVALLEIVSWANKDRRKSVREFVTKVVAAMNAGVHVAVIDLFPPGRPDPRGLHGAAWEGLTGATYKPPKDQPLTLASYVARDPVEAYVTHLAVGDVVPDLSLFLTRTHYINLPLGDTYAVTFRGIPAVWRQVLEAPAQPAL